MIYKIIFLSILFFAVAVRLYRFDNPIADWHSWRQADTSAVSRHFVNDGFDLLHPRFDDLSNVASGIDNPKGYRFVEFPIYNVFQAIPAKYIGILTLEQWGRLVTIISSVLTILFLYLLVKKYKSKGAGLFVAFFYAFLPFNIYYGRVILPDPTMIMAAIGTIYFFDKYIFLLKQKKVEQKKVWSFFLITLLFGIAAVLLKPYALLFLIPMVVVAYNAYGFSLLKQWKLYLLAIGIVIPLFWWRSWMTQYPEGIPASNWLLNGNGIRFRPAFFRWLFYERLTRLILGYVGLLPFIVGIVACFKFRERAFFYSFIVSSLLYVCIFATGNVQHDYYQILTMPSIALFVGLGADTIYAFTKKRIGKIPAMGVVLFISIGMFYFSWDLVKDYFNINNRTMVRVGRVVDENTPKNAKIFAPYDGDVTFLYQTKRQGWASYEKDLPGMIELGADYVVFLSPTKEHYALGKTYQIVASDKDFVLINLGQNP